MDKDKMVYVYLEIIGSISPGERWKIQEKLDEILKSKNIGEVSGGGTTLCLATKEIYSCGIDIDLIEIKHLDELICILRELNIQKKYILRYDDKELEFNCD